MREQTMPTFILVFSVTVAAAVGNVWISCHGFILHCIAAILLVESVLVHWCSNAFPDIECCLSPL